MVKPENIIAIFNPAALSGRLAEMETEIRNELKRTIGDIRFVRTKERDHAREIASNLGNNIELVLAIGGDGTVHETGAGLVEAGSEAFMGIIPMGSGNDFARALFMPSNWRKAIKSIVSGRRVRVDTGHATWKEDGVEKSSVFINALGIGFDAHCAFLAPQYKGWPLKIGYTVCILAGMKSWVSAGATIWDMSNGKELLFCGRMMFTTVGNARDSGGGYSVNPKALVTDGLVDACMVEDMSLIRTLMMLPSARDGNHLKNRAVRYRQVTRLLIETDRGLPIHADGEMQSLQASMIDIRVRPSSLGAVVPKEAPEII